jgi:cell division septum initiation protein DivIVA
MDDVMDPVARAIEELVDQVSSLKARIDEMENRSNAFVDERPEAEIGLVDESIPSSKTKT